MRRGREGRRKTKITVEKYYFQAEMELLYPI